MSDLAEFLRARLGNDEAAARQATAEPGMAAEWHETTSGCVDIGLPDHGGEDWRDFVWPQGDSRVTRFIAEHDPARALREVEAGRKLISRYEDATRFAVRQDHHSTARTLADAQAAALLDAIRDRVAVYSDHPDYRQEWKP